MDYENMMFKVKFVYDDKAFENALEGNVFLREYFKHEYMRLRNIACEELNPHYDEWNKEFNFDAYTIPDDDKLKEFGGTKYCNFIRSKTDPILQRINEKYAGELVELYCDEICDIGGVIRAKRIAGYDHDVHFSCNLIPYNK